VAELSVREVSRLLGVAEKTVWRLVRDGVIPHYRLREEVRFNRVELMEWAQAHGRAVSPELAGTAPAEGLAEALARGGIARDVTGATRDEVLAAIARLPGVPPEVDRALLRELLVSREGLASTGLGGGIAVPHPRDPLVLGARLPTVLLAFPARPLDFGAPDGAPVTTLFAILAPSVQGHLATLSRLAYLLHDAELRRLLEARAPDEAILGRLRAAEAALAAQRPAPPGHDEEEP
jgi:PTS system nitrogen regulatory IIA component